MRRIAGILLLSATCNFATMCTRHFHLSNSRKLTSNVDRKRIILHECKGRRESERPGALSALSLSLALGFTTAKRLLTATTSCLIVRHGKRDTKTDISEEHLLLLLVVAERIVRLQLDDEDRDERDFFHRLLLVPPPCIA